MISYSSEAFMVRPHLMDIPDRPAAKASAGFTLIEIVVSLLLLAVLTSMLGMGIVAALNAYSVSLTNVKTAQKAQIAMGRLSRELMSITDIVKIDDSVPYLIYTNLSGKRAMAYYEGAIKLYSNLGDNLTALTSTDLSNGGNPLIDDISSFTLDYRQAGSVWDQKDIRNLSAIVCSFTLDRNDSTGLSETFNTTIHPRNIKSFGGAAPDAIPPARDKYCFIGTLSGSCWKTNTPAIAVINPGRKGKSTAVLFIFMGALMFMAVLDGRQRILSPTAGCRSNQSGSALLLLIAAIVFFAALGSVLVPLISSSGQMFVGTDNAYKAYLLAESGYRFTASQYLNAGSETARNDQLVGLHQRTFTLADNQGGFTLEIYGYFYEVTANPQGGTALQTRVCAAPADDVNFSGPFKLQLENRTFEFSSASLSGTNTVTFTSSTVLPYIPAGTIALPVADVVQDQQLSTGDYLEYESGDGRLLPLRNGQIMLKGRLLEYSFNDRVHNRLVGIKDPNDPSMSAFAVPAGSQIVLQRFVRLESTGKYGQGQTLTTRKVTYHTPLPPVVSPVQSRQFHDEFENTQHWKTSRWGGHQIEDIGGDKALLVNATEYVPAMGKASLIELDHVTTPVDLSETRRASGGFLSYDTQVKIGFVPTITPPDFGYCPAEPLPCYFAAGLNLRLDADLNGLGVSLLRGRNGIPADGIDGAIVPANDRLGIVLWQQIKTPTGFDRQWLAYKWIDRVAFYEDDMESGSNGWSADGLWHQSTARYTSAEHAWYYGIDASGNYDTGTANSGHLVSPEIQLYPWTYIGLAFDSWQKTELENPDDHDLKTVEISVYESGGWSAWTVLHTLESSVFRGLWLRYLIDISAYAGKKVRIRFTFDKVTDQYNDYEGWYIDNVAVVGTWPVDKATILARLVEAASLEFENGGSQIIEAGDRVNGQVSGATGIVVGPPHLADGSWADQDARGSIWLQNVSGNFTFGETILVVGKGECGKVSGFLPRANFLRVYFGSHDPIGTANADPLDVEKHANLRGQSQLNWPPNDGQPWTVENDYFTLITWDALNTGVTTIDLVADKQFPGCIVKSTESLFFSPSSGLPARSEIGLHAFGDGAQNIYFDDFGLRADVPLAVSVGPPIQE